MDRQTDGHTDVQHETIIPGHYRVVGLKMHMYQKVLSVNINIEGGKKKGFLLSINVIKISITFFPA